MAAFIRGGRSFRVALRQPIQVSSRAFTLAACRFPGSGYTPNSSSDLLHHEHFTKQCYSSSPGRLAAKWLRRQLLIVLALAGVTGGALLVVSLYI